MTVTKTLILIVMIIIMMGMALAIGNWSASMNPDGILPHPTIDEGELLEQPVPRDAYWFGISIGLLGLSLLYGCIAFGLFIMARSQSRPIDKFIYYLAGVAGIGFALSYLVDDYFY